MPYPSTYPLLFDDATRIRAKQLKDWGYLSQSMSGVLRWSTRGTEYASVKLVTEVSNTHCTLTFSYNLNSEPRTRIVNMWRIPSNLGRGFIWKFLCPITFTVCDILYLVDGEICGRNAIRGGMYESQTYSHSKRTMFRILDRYFALDDFYNTQGPTRIYKTYRGRHTKRYQKLLDAERESESISESQYPSLFLI